MIHFIDTEISTVLNYFADKKILMVDSETDGAFDFNNKIILLQLGDRENQFVIDVRKVDIKGLRSLFLSDKIKIFHNAKFDVKFLWLHGLDINNVYDTLLAERLLNAGCERPKGYYALDRLAKDYANGYLDKSVRITINRKNINQKTIQYAADDVKYLMDIRDKQIERLVKLGMSNGDCQDITTVLGLENRSMLAFAAMEYNGIKLDKDKYQKVIDLIDENLDKVMQDLDDIICHEPVFERYCVYYQDLFTSAKKVANVNWNSPIQKLDVLQHMDSTIQSTSAAELLNFKKYDIVNKLMEYNKYSKLKNSFGENMFEFINPVTNRVHTEFWQILDTGRVSCKNPNMQQIPARTDIGGMMRECFVPEQGYKIVGGDYSGCELRIIAEFSQDPVWVNAFKDGKDLHSELCAMTFNIDIKDVKTPTPFKPDIKYRDVQKTLNFGLAYGMSHIKLANTIDISEDEAQSIIKKFFTAVPKVERFLEALGNRGKERGMIKTPPPYGRIRFFEDYKHADNKRKGAIERASKNHPIQGGNADMTKLALIYIYDYIKDKPIKLIHTVHDEIQTEVPDYMADEWAVKMSELMNQAAAQILKTVPMVVDCAVNDYWSK
jgi:DNA polymerase-1